MEKFVGGTIPMEESCDMDHACRYLFWCSKYNRWNVCEVVSLEHRGNANPLVQFVWDKRWYVMGEIEEIFNCTLLVDEAQNSFWGVLNIETDRECGWLCGRFWAIVVKSRVNPKRIIVGLFHESVEGYQIWRSARTLNLHNCNQLIGIKKDIENEPKEEDGDGECHYEKK